VRWRKKNSKRVKEKSEMEKENSKRMKEKSEMEKEK
jgi:hypothetical protein